MTLSDDDKQFIKDTIDYRIKRGSAGGKDTESGKKLSKLEYEEQEKKSRQLLLKELQERDKRGENTIAQKVEMLNLSMKQAIPDDFKDAMKQTGANIKKGTNQAMSGLSHLTNRAMMSNPITAMLWQNRDIAKAMWDVGAGGVKAVAGGIAGLGRGAAGLVNASINMFKRKKKQENIPEDEAPEYREQAQSEQNKEKEDKSTAEKINEIHEWIFKGWKKEKQEQDKEQKEQKTLLSKVLSGLGKTMQAVNGFVEAIQAKQKMIMVGLLMGVGAIVALAAWFTSGKLRDLIGSAVKGAMNSITEGAHNVADKVEDAVTQGTRNKTDTIISQSFAGLNANSIRNYTDKLYGDTKTSGPKVQFQDDGKTYKFMGDKIKALKSKNLMDKATNRLLEDGKHNWANFNASVKSFSNDKGGKKLSFPVAIKMLDAEFNEDGTSSVLIERADIDTDKGMLNTMKQAHNWANQQSPRLVITRVIKILVPNRKVIPKNTHFVVVDKDYQIMGDLSAFMHGENYEAYQNSTDLNKQAGDNYEAFMNKKGMAAEYSKSTDNFNKKESAKQIAAATVKDVVLKPIDKVNEWVQGAPGDDGNFNPAKDQKTEDAVVPTSNVTGDNKSDQKLEQQKQQLKEQDRKQKEAQQQAQKPQQGGQNGGNITLNSKTPSNLPQPANQMDVHKVNMSNSQSIGINN